MNTNQDYRFNDKDRSIEIFRNNLPTPWINYLSNGKLHAFVSQAGGGFVMEKSNHIPSYALSLSKRSYGWPWILYIYS